METNKTNNNPNVEASLTPAEERAFDSAAWKFVTNNINLFGSSPSDTPHPPEVERRIKALKNVQVEIFQTECKFYEELHDLEIKYNLMQQGLYSKRASITSGKYEPSEIECEFKCAEEDSETSQEKPPANGSATPVTGIPKFWLTVFQNTDPLNDLVEPADVPVLEHLEDVKMELTKEPMGFKLLFYFSPNEYFTNDCLVKTYEMRVAIDPKDPLSFEGTEIHKSVGCTINWKEGKDLTKKEVKKKQKHKKTGIIRLTTKLVRCDSFFEFFNPPQVDESDMEQSSDPELQEKITVDFELGSVLKERIIPRAVLYFTGEGISDDEEEEEDDMDSDEEDEEPENAVEEVSGEEEGNN